jgi:hypothetical protein
MTAIIVMRSRTKDKITSTYTFEWSVTRARRDRTGKLTMSTSLVTRKQGEELIEKHGLKECYSTRDGEVYDTPDGAFKALFPDGLRDREDYEQINKLDKI